MADVGNAIIDYLKHARPKTKSNMVFLSQVEPYRPIATATLSGAVSKAIHRAGIETIGRHVGTHTLRHSLATSMMKPEVAYRLFPKHWGIRVQELQWHTLTWTLTLLWNVHTKYLR